MIPKWRPVQVCCKGYARSSNGTSCVPICSQHCYHGQCVEPDICKCDPGFGGPACSKCKLLKTKVWKFRNFSATHILREINSSQFGASNTAQYNCPISSK